MGLCQQISEPLRGFGASVTPAYEGWFNNADGTHSFLIGYLNRNNTQSVDIPIGPANRIEPGGPDHGQPTHFLPGRQTGMFVITVPKDFGKTQRLTWSITAQRPDQQHSVLDERSLRGQPVHRRGGRQQAAGAPLRSRRPGDAGTDRDGGESHRAHRDDGGRPRAPGLGDRRCEVFERIECAAAQSAAAGDPALVEVSRAGRVTFEKNPPPFEKLAGEEAFSGRATVTAKFSQPGEYLLHVNAEDYSGDGGGGEVCCWTTAIVKVTVTQ